MHHSINGLSPSIPPADFPHFLTFFADELRARGSNPITPAVIEKSLHHLIGELAQWEKWQAFFSDFDTIPALIEECAAAETLSISASLVDETLQEVHRWGKTDEDCLNAYFLSQNLTYPLSAIGKTDPTHGRLIALYRKLTAGGRLRLFIAARALLALQKSEKGGA
jgi:hypothetical protein